MSRLVTVPVMVLVGVGLIVGVIVIVILRCGHGRAGRAGDTKCTGPGSAHHPGEPRQRWALQIGALLMPLLSARRRAATAADIAGRGGNVVARVGSTMDQSDASSRRIADTVGTIGCIGCISLQIHIPALSGGARDH
jgi:hypothetical protein